MEETQGYTNTSTKQAWIAEQARKHPERVFTSLHHLIDMDWMREAYRRTRKDGAPGIDGVRAADYERELEVNLMDLRERIMAGSYHAPPVRRHFIPKADGRLRPLGIPTLEDKVAQRAIVMLLEPIYEADFLPCSYGFRPGRSAHEALDTLYESVGRQGQGWVIDADIEGYFDNIPHTELREFLDLRIKDGVVRRMTDKWLKAGVLEDGTLHRSDTGTPQGGVVSPLIANAFLHHVLDRWFVETVQPRLRGGSQLVRYADDCVPRRRTWRAEALRAARLRKRWREALRSRRAGGGCKPPTAAAFKRRGGERARKRQDIDLVRYGSWSRTQVNR